MNEYRVCILSFPTLCMAFCVIWISGCASESVPYDSVSHADRLACHGAERTDSPGIFGCMPRETLSFVCTSSLLDSDREKIGSAINEALRRYWRNGTKCLRETGFCFDEFHDGVNIFAKLSWQLPSEVTYQLLVSDVEMSNYFSIDTETGRPMDWQRHAGLICKRLITTRVKVDGFTEQVSMFSLLFGEIRRVLEQELKTRASCTFSTFSPST